MIKVFLCMMVFFVLACKKKDEDPNPVKSCWVCSGFPLNPDDSLDIGCYYTKQEAMDSVPVPEFRTSEAEFDAHCKVKQ